MLENSIAVAGISRSDLLYASGLYAAFVVLPTQNGLQSLLVDLEQSTFLSEQDKEIYKRGIDRFSVILHLSPEEATQEMSSLMTLIKLYAELDSVCRERFYQDRVGEVIRHNPDSKLLVVVGKSHRLGIAEALADPEYRTPFDDQQVQEFKLLVVLLNDLMWRRGRDSNPRVR
mgnify:CR=1 FL=1|jgi:hypothetical protein